MGMIHGDNILYIGSRSMSEGALLFGNMGLLYMVWATQGQLSVTLDTKYSLDLHKDFHVHKVVAFEVVVFATKTFLNILI